MNTTTATSAVHAARPIAPKIEDDAPRDERRLLLAMIAHGRRERLEAPFLMQLELAAALVDLNIPRTDVLNDVQNDAMRELSFALNQLGEFRRTIVI